MNTPTSIFIVEDESLIAMELKDRLLGLGYAVAGTVAQGEKALATLQTKGVDLVLMDINLSGDLDGIETARRLHEWSDTPVVFVTAYSDSILLERAGKVEPFGYLVKPFE